MASTKLTEYESKRLENIRRNEEMMSSLKIQSMSTELYASAKRLSDEAKSKKASSIKKLRTEATPIVIRQSLRTRGMPPETEGLDGGVAALESPKPSPKPSPRMLGPLRMSKVYWGEGSDRSLIGKIVGMGKEFERVSVSKGENLSESVKEEGSEVGVEELGKDMSFEAENLGILGKKEDSEAGGEEFSRDRVYKDEKSGASAKEEGHDGASLDVYSMTLNPDNIERILSHRIKAIRFFPCASSRMIVAGSILGDVAFWNLDHKKDEEEDGVYAYRCHSGFVTGISIHPHCLTKVFTSCSDGFIRAMDAEKEVFDLIHSSKYAICSLSQRSIDMKCLYFGQTRGLLKIWDERRGKCSTQGALHKKGINSIDFNPENPNLMATCSVDGTACIWDLRSIDTYKPKYLNTVNHERSIQSAYFSPSGKCLATTSFDNSVGILGGVNFEEWSRIPHNNLTGRWISSFKGIWGWDDSYIFIGNMNRGVDILSPAQGKTIFTLQSPDISAIPCRFDVHPYHVGTLAGATAGGQVYVWTMS